MIETKLKCPWCDTSPELTVFQGNRAKLLTLGCVNSECRAQVHFEKYVSPLDSKNIDNAVKFLIESWDKQVVGSKITEVTNFSEINGTKFEKNDDN